MKLPNSFARLFRSYNFEELDDERQSKLIVKTVLAYGEWEEILWLFRHYGREKIGEIFLEDYYGLRTLPESARRLWELLFVPETSPHWPTRRNLPTVQEDSAAKWRGRRIPPS
ncbi:MAG: DUF6922 domain-containing protein [Syntrophothermus sp.]